MSKGNRGWLKIAKEFLWFDLPVDTRRKNETEARNVMKAALASDNDLSRAKDIQIDNCVNDTSYMNNNNETVRSDENVEIVTTVIDNDNETPQPENNTNPNKFSISYLYSLIFRTKKENTTNATEST